MSFSPLTLTYKGRNLLAKVEAGATLICSRIKMGNGVMSGQAIETMADVISMIKSVPISDVVRNDTSATPKGHFSNTNVTDTFKGDGVKTQFRLNGYPTVLNKVTIAGVELVLGTDYTYASGSGLLILLTAAAAEAEIVATYDLAGFYYREQGLFAIDPDEGEIMMAYGNAGSLAEYIAGANESLVEKIVGVNLVVGSTVEVTFEQSSELWQPKTELLEPFTDVEQFDYFPVYDNSARLSRKLRFNTLFSWIQGQLAGVFAAAAHTHSTWLTADVTYYVDPAGGDDSNAGSSSHPFATIAHAISLIPRNHNGYTPTIMLAAGTYEEDVVISGHSGTPIIFSGAADAPVALSGKLTISEDATVKIVNILLTVTNTTEPCVALEGRGRLRSEKNLALSGNGSSAALTAAGDSSVEITGTLTIGNAGAAAELLSGSRLYAEVIAGSGNTIGLSAGGGCVICFGAITMTALSLYATVNGGRILTGAQTNTPSY